jgi:hypothetical protein
MILRLVPPMILLTPLGEAECHFYEPTIGWENHPLWHCFQLETKEPWVWPNPMVRIVESVTGIRGGDRSLFAVSADYYDELMPHILRHKLSPLYAGALSKWENENGNTDLAR